MLPEFVTLVRQIAGVTEDFILFHHVVNDGRSHIGGILDYRCVAELSPAFAIWGDDI